jgi:hypothetical protein
MLCVYGTKQRTGLYVEVSTEVVPRHTEKAGFDRKQSQRHLSLADE